MLLAFGTGAAAFTLYTFWNPDIHNCYYFDGEARSETEYDMLTGEEK